MPYIHYDRASLYSVQSKNMYRCLNTSLKLSDIVHDSASQ